MMAGLTNGIVAAPMDSQEEWNEEKYRSGLAQLERLQNQVNTLRSALPSIIHSLSTPHSTPSSLYLSFKSAAVNSSKGIADLKTTYTSSKTQAVLQKSERSRMQDPDGGFDDIDQIPVYGFLDEEEQRRRLADMARVQNAYHDTTNRRNVWVEQWNEEVLHQSQQTKPADASGDTLQNGKTSVQEKPTPDSEIEPLLTAFKAENEGKEEMGVTSVSWTDDLKKITIGLKTHLGSAEFEIEREEDGDDDDDDGVSTKDFEVTCIFAGTSYTTDAITRAFSKRPKQMDLAYTLDMIKAYSTLGRARCDTCYRLIGNRGTSPSVRAQREKDGELQWVALHEHCASV